MPFRLVFLGMLGSGKSHVAREAARLTGGVVLPFAKDVYRLTEAVLGRRVDKKIPSDRALLKTIGTDWGREGRADVDPALQSKLATLWSERHGYADIWVDSFVRYAEAQSGMHIFNDDTRFPNELCRTVGLGFLPFYVGVSETTRAQRLALRGEAVAPDAYSHPSEIMNTTLSTIALDQNLAPIVWNDTAPAPKRDWIVGQETFFAWLSNGDAEALAAFAKQSPPQVLCDWARSEPWKL
ncbi:MAG: hypothetical protein IPL62_10455 [Caulobacteraceae bacterium]|nr:hypothetical protein [Caulobacteraceae bacterium]MBP6689666.1 hypothetical protein [Hyphomonadaceae bacterium]